MTGNPLLSEKARSIIQSDQRLLFSIASLWEMAIKTSINKLEVSGEFSPTILEEISLNQIEILGIEFSHISKVQNLPFFHKDPFDRMIIAQGIAESIPIISADAAFDHYDITRIW